MVEKLRSFVGWTVGMFWSFFGKFNFLPFNFDCNNHNTPTRNLIIGAYYYPWWNDDHWSDGYLREYLSPNQEFMLGHYSVRDRSVIDQHLQWAEQYRISHFIASWWGRDTFEDMTIRDYLLPACSTMDCNNNNNGDQVQVGLFYESRGILERDDDNRIQFVEGGSNEQQLKSDFEYMAQTYFGHSNYLKIDGKPVVYLYLTRTYRGNYQQVWENLRSHIRTNYGYELYLVGDEVWWNDPNEDRIKIFDAITAYNTHGPAEYDGYPEDTNWINDVETLYKTYQDVANNLQVDLIPGILPAFNDRGFRLSTDHYVIPHEVSANLAGSGRYTTLWESLQMAYRVLQSRKEENSPTIIMITSWNEFHEDTAIEPTKGTASSSTEPSLYTQGYTFEDYGMKLLELLPRFLDEVAAAAAG